jgi:hypothetical protein
VPSLCTALSHCLIGLAVVVLTSPALASAAIEAKTVTFDDLLAETP